MKKNLLVSFSGGETSAFMSQWIKKHLQNSYENIIYVFANTGLENEETLQFTKKCDEYWNLNIKWVESNVNFEKGKGTSYFLTNFNNASRKGEPFELIIKKYGIPNQAAPHCTRELKQNPIKAFAKDFFNGEKYDTAIGIRIDEADRINQKSKDMMLIYPLINQNMIPASKQMINFFWKQMPFRLELKGYQGNCITCWKKSDKKLFQIYKDNPKSFDFMRKMEEKYPRIGNEFDKDLNFSNRTFFRNNRSAEDIISQAKNWNGKIKNDSNEYSYQLDLLGGDSCEVFSECSA
jgi:hypothetical protein